MTGKQLKNSILQWAIQGKLVPQDPNDEPASVLLEKIRAEKARLVKEGKIKKDKKESIIYRGDDNSYYEKFADGTTVCIDDEIPFDVPKGWEWCRLGNLVDFSKSNSVKADKIEANAWLLDLEDIEKDTGKLLQKKRMGNTNSISDKHHFFAGNVLYSKLRPYLNKVIIADEDGFCTSEILCFDFGHIFNKYAQLYLMSPFFVEYAMSDAYGVKMPRLGSKQGNNGLMPIPPLEEQKRIVSSVSVLAPVIEKYSKAQDSLDKLNKEIKGLLKKSILQEAIQGRLVPQDASEEPTSILLQRIKDEKLRLVKQGKLKKKDVTDSTIFRGDDNKYYEQIGKEVVDITEDIPFEIPDSWQWARWGNLSHSIQYGYNAPAEETGDIRMVRISDIQNGEVLWATVPYCHISPNEIDTYLLQKDDILFARTGGTVGKSFLVKEVPYPSIYAGYLIRTRYSQYLSSQYMKYFMESQLYWEQLRNGTIATAQPNCNGKTLAKMILPIPPFNEQIRITEKLNQVLERMEKYGGTLYE